MMFTDVANFTAAVSGSNREKLRQILAEHENVVAPIVAEHGGQVVKNLGDSFLCVFDAATEGLRAGLAIVSAVLPSAGGARIRVSVNTGDIEEIDGDVFGEPVNLAARILGQAPGGEIWFGPATRACINASELPWEPTGRFRLKGIAGQVDLYRGVPNDRCWLPDVLKAALRRNRMVRLRPGEAVPNSLPLDPMVVLDGFDPASPELDAVMKRLPALDPANIWLRAYIIGALYRSQWAERGHSLLIGQAAALDDAIREGMRAPTRGGGSDTMILEDDTLADLDVVICGLALPAVPLADVVQGYAYDMMQDGRWVVRAPQPVVRVEVSPSTVRLRVLAPGVAVGGRGMGMDEVIPLDDGVSFSTAAGRFTFRKLDRGYLGAIFGEPTMSIGVAEGETAEVGREPQHPGLTFPDRRGQENLRWCAGARAERARMGGFTLDRALAGRRQASVTLRGDLVEVQPLHDRCATYLLRQGSAQLQPVTAPVSAALGDSLVVGTTVVGLRPPN